MKNGNDTMSGETVKGGKRLTSQSTSSHTNIVNRFSSDRNSEVISDKPIHYSTVHPAVRQMASALERDLLRQYQHGKSNVGMPKGAELLRNCQEVQPGMGYYKAHINDAAVHRLQSLDILPDYLKIKDNASQKGILFFNSQNGTCVCHFDRDSSALYLVSGNKEVKIASPMKTSDRPADGILHDVNPFSEKEDEHGGYQWETMHLTPGDVSYYLPFALVYEHHLSHIFSFVDSFHTEVLDSLC